jgi:riboflavin synthase
MFTGIIRHVGKITAITGTQAGKVLTIDLGPLAGGIQAGSSVAVNGACLTASAARGDVWQFDVIGETLLRTTLGALRVGSEVNLEPALRADQALDGHIVQGHVDAIAHLLIAGAGAEKVLRFSAGEDLTDLMVAKGSVAVDGVSLTIVDVGSDFFSVALIPTTLRETTLGKLVAGSAVNIETDIIGRYVRKFLRGGSQKNSPPPGPTAGPGLTMEKLKDAGFI